MLRCARTGEEPFVLSGVHPTDYSSLCAGIDKSNSQCQRAIVGNDKITLDVGRTWVVDIQRTGMLSLRSGRDLSTRVALTRILGDGVDSQTVLHGLCGIEHRAMPILGSL